MNILFIKSFNKKNIYPHECLTVFNISFYPVNGFCLYSVQVKCYLCNHTHTHITVLRNCTSGFLECRTSSVELWPTPDGIPAVRYMEPTTLLFRPSFAPFTSSTVTPSSAKLCTPGLAISPSCHSRYRSLWVTAVGRMRGQNKWVPLNFLRDV